MRVKTDRSDLLTHIDLVSNGAATTFLVAADDTLKPIRLRAIAGWPVKTGESRAAFILRRRLTPNSVSVTLTNAQRYAYAIRWSVRTKLSLDAEAANPHKDDIADVARGFAKMHRRRGTEAELRTAWAKRLRARHGQGAPSERLAGKRPWDVLVSRPGVKATPDLIDACQTALTELAKDA